MVVRNVKVCNVENILNQISYPSKFLRRGLLAVVSLVAMAQVQAQDFRVAFFDGQRVLNESLPAKVATSKIEQEFSRRKKELDEINERWRALVRRFEKDAPGLSDSDRIKRQRELTDLDQEFNRKQRVFNEDLGQRKQEELNALAERALKVVKQIAEAEKIDLVVQDAAYINPRIDITDKVLKALSK
jgi:outer membrane protein